MTGKITGWGMPAMQPDLFYVDAHGTTEAAQSLLGEQFAGIIRTRVFGI